MLVLDILSTVATLSGDHPQCSNRFGCQVIDCVKTQKNAEDWLMTRIVRDFGGKDKLGELVKVSLSIKFLTFIACKAGRV